jgi:hypothetical protein
VSVAVNEVIVSKQKTNMIKPGLGQRIRKQRKTEGFANFFAGPCGVAVDLAVDFIIISYAPLKNSLDFVFGKFSYHKFCTGLVFLCIGCDTPTTYVVPTKPNVVFRIPVVVHVLYNEELYNISDEKIHSQIRVLNQDFNKRNTDTTRIPSEFKDLTSSIGIEFHMASVDPSNRPTSGITRTHSSLNGFAGYDPTKTKPVESLALFFTNLGGRDAWPTDKYLNIWVVEMSNRHENLGLAGYSHFPGGDARIDGIVIDPRAFGTLEPLATNHRFGRTATHEIGHWLNLIHIFGVQEGCQSTDSVADTPPTATHYSGNPTYPQHSCGHSNMFMNFMDYVDDEAMCMFTDGQKQRMLHELKPGGRRTGFGVSNH